MGDNYNYPPGADTKFAPWNQRDPREYGPQHVEQVCEDLWDYAAGEDLLSTISHLMQREINTPYSDKAGRDLIKTELWRAFSMASDRLAEHAQEIADDDEDWQWPDNPDIDGDYYYEMMKDRKMGL